MIRFKAAAVVLAVAGALATGSAAYAMPASADTPATVAAQAGQPGGWMIPHRGAGAAPDGINPESTMQAYKYAVNTLGLRTVDVDLWRTSNGALMIHHNATLTDTTCGGKNITKMTGAQVHACKYLSNGEPVLFYSDVLDEFGSSVTYTPEPKSTTTATYTKLLSQIQAYGLQANTLVQATNLAQLDRFVAAGIPTERGSVSSDAVANSKSAWVSTLKAHGIEYVSVSESCSDQTFHHYLANGIRVLAWTVDQASDYNRLRSLPEPPTGYFSNDPPLIEGQS